MIDTYGMPAAMQRAYEVLPERLRDIREERGLTKAEAGRESGMDARLIARYEAGERYPGFYNLVRMAAFYKVEVGWLLGEK